MIAVATPASSDSGMVFDWFDLVFIAILIFALYRGRHNGMSKELIPLLQWIAILFVCGLVHPMLGPIFATQLKLTQMWGNVLAYAVLMLAVLIPFSIIKHRYAKNLATSDFFKGNEYYLGMIAGIVKWLCIMLVAMALLNAPYYSPAQIAAHKAYMQKVYGGGDSEFSGDFFPTLQTVQEVVLTDSAVGSFVLNQPFLKKLLINVKPPPPKPKPLPIIQFGNAAGH